MAVPAGPQIKLSDVAAEFSDTAPHQMSEFYRGGAKVPNTPGNAAVATSGALGLQSFKGTQNRAVVPLTISSGTTNYDVYTQASANPSYVAGISDIELTINPGVTVSSTSTGTYALNVPNSFNPTDTVKITNNGTVQGRGGNGGTGAAFPNPGGGGGAGGSAVYVNFPTTIDNVGSLTGGGGGGGGGGASLYQQAQPKTNITYSHAGGGGGGGAGTPGGSGGGAGTAYGGQPIAYNRNGSAGSGGSANAGGSGGLGGYPAPTPAKGGIGGAGGGRGANGSGGSSGIGSSNPAFNRPGGGGGARGYYLVGNPLVTFESTGTRQGNVS